MEVPQQEEHETAMEETPDSKMEVEAADSPFGELFEEEKVSRVPHYGTTVLRLPFETD